MRSAFLGLVVCLTFCVGAVQAQSSGLAFLGIGPDAAGMALGDAGVAAASGPFSTERNPAGLAQATTGRLGLTHHQWVADVKTYGLAGRFAMGAAGGLGLYVRASGSADFQARDQPGASQGNFDVQFVSAGAGVGRAFGPLSVGIAAKYLSERIFSVSATGYAMDLGAQASFLNGSVRFGAALLNVGSMEDLVDRPTELPRTFRVGTAIQPFRVLSFDDGATVFDAVLTVEMSRNTVTETSHVHVGAAADVLETLRVRLGYISNDALRDFSAGVGITAGPLRLDYAILPFEEGFGGPGHIFTLVYDGF